MPQGLLPWIMMPLVGALIGYVTNRLAVHMIFRPVEPKRFLGMTLQGLVPRRQAELAKSIGAVVGDHLVRPEDLREALDKVDLEGVVDRALDKGLGAKLAELRKLPLVGGFLTDERVAELRKHAVQGIIRNKDDIADALQQGLEKGVNVHELVESKVNAFPVTRMEELILQVASRELKSIELLGGVLGGFVGLVQAGLLALL